MRAGVLVALALLAGCAFGAERALFEGGDAARPFADGARSLWIVSDEPERRQQVTFRQQPGGRYTIENVDEHEDPMRNVLFVAIADTPEDDYVAQVRLNTEEESVAFVYMWRSGEGYRVVISPGGLFPNDNLSAADPYCQWQTYQGCSLSRREDVFAVYRALIYPAFVTGDQTPESYLDIVPLDGTAQRPPKGRK